MYNCPTSWYTVVDEMSVDEMSVDELSWNRAVVGSASEYRGLEGAL